MPAHSPGELNRLFNEALHARNVDSLVALYEPEAILVALPGKLVTGTEAIRQAMLGYIAMNPKMEFLVQQVLRVDNTALVHASWEMTGPLPIL